MLSLGTKVHKLIQSVAQIPCNAELANAQPTNSQTVLYFFTEPAALSHRKAIKFAKQRGPVPFAGPHPESSL